MASDRQDAFASIAVRSTNNKFHHVKRLLRSCNLSKFEFNKDLEISWAVKDVFDKSKRALIDVGVHCKMIILIFF